MATQAQAAMLTTEAVSAHPTDAKSENKDIENTKEEVDHSVTDSEDLDLERWNEPRANAYRYFATIFAFTIMGMNDAAYGLYCDITGLSRTIHRPPYAVLPVIFAFSGFGIGLLDGAFNAWVGNMEHANE
ncbi:hypothetical protein M7I_6601 [Glarea lozoyensis 74030]|uniref:MFS general substrate transporter n=1 Tax=Glarea lozoyensis (strain ATCC 74030 / MF5533) TaxID=1104152 RepID=H0EV09_GLAL7|nr:hypothetical protein M7I_6601 [Glarea lozoyensis 74030]